MPGTHVLMKEEKCAPPTPAPYFLGKRSFCSAREAAQGLPQRSEGIAAQKAFLP